MNSESEKKKTQSFFCAKRLVPLRKVRAFRITTFKHLKHWCIFCPCIKGKDPGIKVSYKTVIQNQLIPLFYNCYIM